MRQFHNILHSITVFSATKGFIKNNRACAKFHTFLLIFILLFCGASTWLIKANAQQSTDIQEGIAQKIIRFHVIANSDSDQDQALKLKVKDQLVKSLAPLLEDAPSISAARSIISGHLAFIQSTAEAVIQANGYHYPVRVSLENCYFPLKLYGNCAFPPGIYEALRVRIGAAEGKNWWCVMFPPLCFVDETYSVVDEKTDHKLKHLLTDEEYHALIQEKKPVKIKFKLWKDLKKLVDEL